MAALDKHVEESVKDLLAFRTKILVGLLGVVLIAGALGGELRLAVASNQKAISKEVQSSEEFRKEQQQIQSSIKVIENEIGHIKDDQREQKELLKQIELNTRRPR